MMTYPVIELGGAGQTLNIAVANGFPPETYLPMLNPLMAQYRLVSLLPRALWGGESVPETLGTWETDLARDLLGGLREHSLTGVIAVGHSFGGIVSILAALQEPSRFRALVLLDPTILTPQIIEWLKSAVANGTIGEDFPLAARAAKRQRRFATREDAFDYFRQRGIFKDWDESALRAYVDHGLIPDGDNVVLRWPPEWEAYYFKTGYTETWNRLPQLDGLLPTLILRGAESDTYTAESAADVRVLLPSATHIEIPGHGHLFPQSAPAKTGEIVSDWLAALG